MPYLALGRPGSMFSCCLGPHSDNSGCCCRCLAKEVWVQPLAGSFLRLALQLLARFQTYLLEGLAARSAALSAPAAECGDADKATSAWAVGVKAEQLCSVRADAEKIVDWLNSDYTQQIQRLLSFTSQEVHKPSDSLNVA